jgi:Protein of unknown function (DUF3152)
VSVASRSAICLALVIGAVVVSAAAARADGFTYKLGRRDTPVTDMRAFARIAGDTFSDGRGWSLSGHMPFTRAASGGDFRLVLASPASVAGSSPYCSAFYSCRVGDLVLINIRRWQEPPPSWTRSLHAYRHYVINHEVGHWLGLAHTTCADSGSKALVMLQQSKALNGCRANEWPTPAELQEIAAIHRAHGWNGEACEGERQEDPCGHSHPRLGAPAEPHRLRPEPL